MWKIGDIVPHFKDGNKQSVANYRPITLLCCLSKVFETLLFIKLSEVINGLISPTQFGFTKKKSTKTQMIMYLSEVFDNLHRETLATLYLDFQKAFDKVCHEKLIEKLHASGIRGNALLLLESYLVGRKQKVRI